MKPAARRAILEKRDALTPEQRAEKSEAIARALFGLPEYQSARAVLFYIEFRSEVITRPMVGAALAAGKRVLAPKVEREDHLLRLYELTDPEKELGPGYMGIPEPDPSKAREVSPGEVDLVVLPGVGFDASCARLGYGGGYYDRLIERLRDGVKLVALAFEAQLVDAVPSEPHDKRMDAVVTEDRVIRPRWT